MITVIMTNMMVLTRMVIHGDDDDDHDDDMVIRMVRIMRIMFCLPDHISLVRLFLVMS